jgi:sigma-B regulation protein RsbU (phosphoserine phosphatase)
LRESQARLAAELAEASAYVQALLPQPISGDISTDWQSIPSEELGGDLFGYRFLDDDRFACYLFDVSGHGVGAALLSVSVANSLRSESMSDVDFADPSAVLSALNAMFEMEKNNNMYFTAWYGVYTRSKREIVYASGGHPPALLVSYAADGPRVERLKTPGMIVGGMPGVPFPSARCAVAPGSRLLVFSDGVYEVTKQDGGEMTLDEFERLAVQPPAAGVGHTEAILARVRALRGAASFEDDFSILCVSLV